MTADMEMVRAAINNNTSVICVIQPTYIDFGANWKEDTVVSVYPRTYQILSPRDVELAAAGMLTMDALQKVIDEINERGW